MKKRRNNNPKPICPLGDDEIEWTIIGVKLKHACESAKSLRLVHMFL